MPIVAGQRRTKQVTETLTHCPSRKAAEGVLAKRNAALFEGTYRPRNAIKPVLVPDHVVTFLEARKNELASWSSYKYSLNRHVAPYFKRKYMHDVTTGDCEDYRRHRLAQGAAPATVRNELRYLQSLFADARKRGLVTHDPVADVSFAAIRNAPQRAPAPADVLRLVEAARAEPADSYTRPLFFVLLTTGMRLQSALTLRWEHVDYERGSVGTVQKGGSWVYPPMPELLRGELRLWEPMSRAISDEGFVFPSVNGGHVSKGAVVDAWNALLKRAEVSGITRHDMRRFVVTRLRQLGADNRAIQQVSGHATAAMIDRYDKRGLEDAAVFSERASDLVQLSDVARRQAEAEKARRKS